jgi:uncharacterized membrane protein YqjE
MTLQSLFRLITTQPQLLLDHVEAYSELVVEEIADVSSAYKRRLLYGVLALLLAALGITFTGIALLLWATAPLAQIHSPWLLWAVPMTPLVLALVCSLVAKNNARQGAFTDLRSQLRADMAMLRTTKAAT